MHVGSEEGKMEFLSRMEERSRAGGSQIAPFEIGHKEREDLRLAREKIHSEIRSGH